MHFKDEITHFYVFFSYFSLVISLVDIKKNNNNIRWIYCSVYIVWNTKECNCGRATMYWVMMGGGGGGGSTPPNALIGQGSIQQLGLFIDVTDVSLRTWNCESVALLRSSQPTSRTRENSRRSSVQRTGWGFYSNILLQSFYFYKLDIFLFHLISSGRLSFPIARWRRCLDLFLLTQLSYLRLTASWNPCWRTPWNCPFITMKVDIPFWGV